MNNSCQVGGAKRKKWGIVSGDDFCDWDKVVMLPKTTLYFFDVFVSKYYTQDLKNICKQTVKFLGKLEFEGQYL